MQGGDRDGDVLAAQFRHDQRSSAEIAGGKQGGGFRDTAGPNMAADRLAGMRHVHRVKLSRRVAVQRRTVFPDHREQPRLVAAPVDGAERGDRGQIRRGRSKR